MTSMISPVLLAVSGVWLFYTFLGYPLLLRLWTRRASGGASGAEPDPELPHISISVPAYNEAAQIRATLESLLRIDYPEDRRQILVISDASSDGTDDIVREYEHRGIELFRLPNRVGKTAAENAAAPRLRGEIVINTDASIRISPGAVRELVRQFADPGIGLASGTDISVSPASLDDVSGEESASSNAGESSYVGHEMGIRELETRAGGIVGASGCFYAVRRHLHLEPLPDDLSRDFGAALITREKGYRAVSVPTATARVPRSESLTREYRRKVRTMTRGIRTLWFKRHLLNPAKHGRFAVMLFSHKVMRWGLPWALLMGVVGVGLSLPNPRSLAVVGSGLLALSVASLVWALAATGRLRGRAAVPAWVLSSLIAAGHAAVRALLSGGDAVWEPTRRTTVSRS